VSSLDLDRAEESSRRAGDEPVDLVDEINRIIGRAPRREVRSRNLLHRGVGILCVNATGQLYVHKRTETKDVFPGMYDMFVGGVVTSGEAYDQAARREIAEELGIVGPEPEFLFAHLYLGDRNRSWIYVYRARWDGAIRHQPEEIVWGDWMGEAEVLASIREKPFVPDGLDIFFHYLAWRQGRGAAERHLT